LTAKEDAKSAKMGLCVAASFFVLASLAVISATEDTRRHSLAMLCKLA
jgi:hypothetical protein